MRISALLFAAILLLCPAAQAQAAEQSPWRFRTRGGPQVAEPAPPPAAPPRRPPLPLLHASGVRSTPAAPSAESTPPPAAPSAESAPPPAAPPAESAPPRLRFPRSPRHRR